MKTSPGLGVLRGKYLVSLKGAQGLVVFTCVKCGFKLLRALGSPLASACRGHRAENDNKVLANQRMGNHRCPCQISLVRNRWVPLV